MHGGEGTRCREPTRELGRVHRADTQRVAEDCVHNVTSVRLLRHAKHQPASCGECDWRADGTKDQLDQMMCRSHALGIAQRFGKSPEQAVRYHVQHRHDRHEDDELREAHELDLIDDRVHLSSSDRRSTPAKVGPGQAALHGSVTSTGAESSEALVYVGRLAADRPTRRRQTTLHSEIWDLMFDVHACRLAAERQEIRISSSKLVDPTRVNEIECLTTNAWCRGYAVLAEALARGRGYTTVFRLADQHTNISRGCMQQAFLGYHAWGMCIKMRKRPARGRMLLARRSPRSANLETRARFEQSNYKACKVQIKAFSLTPLSGHRTVHDRDSPCAIQNERKRASRCVFLLYFII
eukprot:scaffold96651_cov65-Phaeocystis_antarctica.AAC.5